MTESHPDKWMYAGILVRDTWRSKEAGMVKLMLSGVATPINYGDELLMLQSPRGIHVISVEHTQSWLA